jgi:hypothetical protein
MFLHIMIAQNSKKSNAKKLHYCISYDVMLKYICAKKNHNMLKKCKYIQKMIEMILNFMKFVLCTKHCDSIWLE